MMPRTWLTADTHFHHRRVIDLCSRPFSDVAEMHETMVSRWNAIVGRSDVVWHLGDFAWRDRDGEAAAIFSRLSGRKHLVVGNHDGDAVRALPWESQQQMAQVVVDGQRLHLCHYPLLEWQGFHRGAWHLFGPVHGAVEGVGASLDVGVDEWDFGPVSLDDVRRRLRERGRIE